MITIRRLKDFVQIQSIGLDDVANIRVTYGTPKLVSRNFKCCKRRLNICSEHMEGGVVFDLSLCNAFVQQAEEVNFF